MIELSEPITVRAHHLDSYERLKDLPREKLAQLCIQEGYVTDARDGFVDHLRSVFRLMDNPNQRVRIVIGEKDRICKFPCERKCDADAVCYGDKKVAESLDVCPGEYTMGDIFGGRR